jgi:putative ABC transport system permease protein
MMYVICGVFVAAAAALLVPLLYTEKGRRGFTLALRSLWLHKLRSFLSVLGIIIGTAAVVALMSFGEGSMQAALADIRRLGTTNIIIKSVKPPDDSSNQQGQRVAIYGLTYEDYDRISTISTITRRVPMRIFPQEIRNLQYNLTGRVVATTPEYVEVNTLEMAEGRFLTPDDDHQMLNVAVLASGTAEYLFPFGDPLGQSVRLGKYFYRVVGVLKDRVATGGGNGAEAEDFNKDVYIPLSTCKVRFGARIVNRRPGSMTAEQVQLNQVTISVADMDEVRPAGEVVTDLLGRYHGARKDWRVEVPLERLKLAEAERSRFNNLMAMIAGISLLVGGIGIMNIMLATVTERTREIGIRRALGAKRRDITVQFLIEAVVQTSVGGLSGILSGITIVLAFPPIWEYFANSPMPAKIHVPAIFLSLGVSVLVGVGFGLYPAMRAARLDPIEALRHE